MNAELAAPWMVFDAAMHFIHRILSLVLACLVLLWAGNSMAVDNYHAAEDLAEQVQTLDPAAEEKFDLSSLDPLDCPALACKACSRARLLLDDPPNDARPIWRSVIPRLTSPPPRRA
ncbi:hypothetical protein [Zoogloea sp.]|uniref:hypothetical protein n=1 Tax=Zoogloea sp. TaxID=49181 RepID=UPI0035B4CAE8